MVNTATLSDSELISLLKEGDTAAFTEIYKRYWQKIYIIAVKRIGDAHDAEEIVQEIFLSLWRRRGSIASDIIFSNYFSIAVKFEVIDIMRKRAQADKYQLELLANFTDADFTTLRRLDMNELQQRLQFSIDTLPEKCRLVFDMKHEQGLSQKHIARNLSISEKAVEAHLANARKKLRLNFGSILPGLLLFYFL